MDYLFVHLVTVKYTSTFIPVLWAVPISISLTPVPYISPPMEHLKNSIKFLVKVPVLSEKIYSTCIKNTRNPVRLKVWLCWTDKQKLITGEERKRKDWCDVPTHVTHVHLYLYLCATMSKGKESCYLPKFFIQIRCSSQCGSIAFSVIHMQVIVDKLSWLNKFYHLKMKHKGDIRCPWLCIENKN